MSIYNFLRRGQQEDLNSMAKLIFYDSPFLQVE